MPTYAHSHDGSFTGLNDGGSTLRICIASASLFQRFYVFDTTQSGDGRPGVFRASARMEYIVNGTGWYEVDSGGTWYKVRLTDNVASLTGSIFGRNSIAILRKRTVLHNVTAAEDAVPNTQFEVGQTVYDGSCRGFLQSTETPWDEDHNDPGPGGPALNNLTLPLGSNVVTGNIIVDFVRGAPDFRVSGPVPVDYAFRMTGSITTTSTPFALDSFNASINLDNGQTASGTVKFDELRADLDYRTGGPVPFRFSGKFDGEPSFV